MKNKEEILKELWYQRGFRDGGFECGMPLKLVDKTDAKIEILEWVLDEDEKWVVKDE